MTARFIVRFHGYVTLPTGDIWPDDDGPEEPTAEDVKALMERCGTKRQVLDDWCLLDDLEVHVGAAVPLSAKEVQVWER